MSTTGERTTGSLFIKHPNSTLRINMRGGRIYVTMSLATNGKITMALTPEEALAISTYLQAKAQYLLSKGAFIGIKGQAKQATKATKTGRKPAEAGAKGGEAGATGTPKEAAKETPGEVGEEDIGEEEE